MIKTINKCSREKDIANPCCRPARLPDKNHNYNNKSLVIPRTILFINLSYAYLTSKSVTHYYRHPKS